MKLIICSGRTSYCVANAIPLFVSCWIFLAVFSCQDKLDRMPKEFYKAIAMAEGDRDSIKHACRIMDSLAKDTVKMSEAEKMYFQLKRIFVNDKLGDAPIPIERARLLADYYSSDGPDSLLMYSYYYMGGAYRDRMDIPQAIEWYVKALAVADRDTALWHNSFYPRLCIQAGMMYSDIFLARKGISVLKKALKSNCTRYAPYVYEKIACCFSNLGEVDSAMCYLDKSYDAAFMYISSGPSRQKQIYTQLSSIFNMRNREHPLDDAIRKRADGLLDYQETQEGAQFIAFRQRVKADYYRYINCPDSAKLYYGRVLDFHDNMVKSNAARKLMEMAFEAKDYDEAGRYSRLYTAYSDSAYKETEIAYAAAAEQYFNYQQVAKEKLQQEKDKQQWMWMYWATSSCLIFMIIYGIRSYRRWKRVAAERLRRMDEELADYKTNEAKLRSILEVENNRVEELKVQLVSETQARSDLLSEIGRHEAHIQQLNIQIERLRISLDDIAGGAPRLRERLIRHAGKITTSLWMEVKRVMDAKYPDLWHNIERVCPWISDTDLMIVYLLGMGNPPVLVASLLNISRQNLNAHKSRLYGRVLGDAKAGRGEESNLFIQSLLGKARQLVD